MNVYEEDSEIRIDATTIIFDGRSNAENCTEKRQLYKHNLVNKVDSEVDIKDTK